MAQLSQKFAKTLAPTDSDTWHWDDTLKGFAVRQRPGREPQWWVRYSINGGKKKHLIGACSVVKANAARERAREILQGARVGKDHNQEARTLRDAPTIAELSREHLEIHQPPKISEAYYRDKKAAWKNHILPKLGKVLVAELSRSDVEKFHLRYRAQPALGNGLLAILSKALSDSTEFKPPWRTDNPCRGVKKFTVEHRQRILSEAEIRVVFEKIDELKARGHNLSTWSMPWLIQLLLLTGLRLRELANREWKQIDLDRGTLTIPKPKGKKKARHVSLPDVALEVLRLMPRRGPWVFPNSNGDGPFVSPQKHWQKIRKELGLEDVRVHDLRHTVASYGMHSGGLSQREVMELLGHSQMSTTERYLNIHDERKQTIGSRAAMAIISPSVDTRRAASQNQLEE